MSGLTSSIHRHSTASIAGSRSSEANACGATEGHCITCGDEGIAMRVVASDGASAVCTDDQRRRHEIAVDLVAPVRAGDGLLVHAGVAIRHLGAAT